MEASLFLRHLQMKEIAQDSGCEINPSKGQRVFETLIPPLAASQLTSGFAYGGLVVAIMIQGTYHVLLSKKMRQHMRSSDQNLETTRWSTHSVTGHFLGPVTTESVVRVIVEVVRSTRSFQTFMVKLCVPKLSEGHAVSWEVRTVSSVDFCRSNSKDFHHILTNAPLRFTETPHNLDVLHSGPDEFLDLKKNCDLKVSESKVTQTIAKTYMTIFELPAKLTDFRVQPQSLDSETMCGLRPINAKLFRMHNPEKVGYDGGSDISHSYIYHWIRGREDFSLRSLVDINLSASNEDAMLIKEESVGPCFAAFFLDARVPAALWSTHHLSFAEGCAAGTLDFAYHFHSDFIDAEAWYLMETNIEAEGNSRYQGRCKLFNKAGEKQATMTQSCFVAKFDELKSPGKDRGKL